MRAVGRVLIALAGFVAAVVAAALFLFVARFGFGPVDAAASPVERLDYLIWAGLAASHLGAAAFVPGCLMILASEILRLRSLLFHVGFGGALGAAAALGVGRIAAAATSERFTLLLAAGFVGGFVYWAVAGRTAGLVGVEAGADEPSAGPRADP